MVSGSGFGVLGLEAWESSLRSRVQGLGWFILSFCKRCVRTPAISRRFFSGGSLQLSLRDVHLQGSGNTMMGLGFRGFQLLKMSL